MNWLISSIYVDSTPHSRSTSIMKEPPRRRARILALQIIYSRSYTGISPQGERLLGQAAKLKPVPMDFAYELVDQVWNNLPQLDGLIQTLLKEWRQERLSSSLSALLRLGVSEILHWPKTDAKVILNEMVDICKSHVDPEAASLTNGVLHQLAADLGRLPAL